MVEADPPTDPRGIKLSWDPCILTDRDGRLFDPKFHVHTRRGSKCIPSPSDPDDKGVRWLKLRSGRKTTPLPPPPGAGRVGDPLSSTNSNGDRKPEFKGPEEKAGESGTAGEAAFQTLTPEEAEDAVLDQELILGTILGPDAAAMPEPFRARFKRAMIQRTREGGTIPRMPTWLILWGLQLGYVIQCAKNAGLKGVQEALAEMERQQREAETAEKPARQDPPAPPAPPPIPDAPASTLPSVAGLRSPG